MLQSLAGNLPNGITQLGSLDPTQLGGLESMLSALMATLVELQGGSNSGGSSTASTPGASSAYNALGAMGQNAQQQMALSNPALGSTGGAEGAFAQGAQGNCASVAVIKGAMQAYGNNMFQSVTSSGNGGYNIRMKDGFTEQVSAQDVAQTQANDGFRGSGPGDAMANLAFAAEAKRATLTHHDGDTTMGQALHDLDNGQWPTQAAGLLGLENNIQMVNPSQAGQMPDAVAWNNDHAIYVQNGAADHYGTPEAYNGTDTIGHAINGAFTFTPDGSSGGGGTGAVPAAAAPDLTPVTGGSNVLPTPTVGGGSGSASAGLAQVIGQIAQIIAAIQQLAQR